MKKLSSPLCFGNYARLLACASALTLPAGASLGASYTWGFNAGGNWNDSGTSAGWNASGAYPSAVDDVANLTFNITSARAVAINVTDATVGTLNLQDTGGTPVGWTVSAVDAAVNRLTFETSSGNAQLTSAGAANLISAPVILNSNLDISSASTLTLSGSISGAGSITKSGAASTLITTSNITSGKSITVTEGLLGLNGTTAASYSNLQVQVGAGSGNNNATLNLAASSGSHFGSSNTITIVSGNSGTAFLQHQNNGNGATIQAGVVLGSGGVGKGVTLQNVNSAGTANTGNFLGVFSDPGSLSGAGGVVTLAGNVGISGVAVLRFGNAANSYSGGTIVESGNIQLFNGTGNFFGTGTVTVNGGSFRNNGNGATTVNGYSSMILNADLNFYGSDSSGNNFTGTTNLGATGTAASRVINTTNTAAGSLTLSGVITNGSNGFTTGITKTGAASLTLSGSNTYTGMTTISAGTLVLGAAGSINSSAGVNLGTSSSQGTLSLTLKPTFAFGVNQTVSGFGTINIGSTKIVTVSGTLAPGNSTGQINVTGTLALENTTDTDMELAGSGGVKGADFDNIAVTGSVLYDGDLSIASFGGFNIYQDGIYSLFDFGTAPTGNFDSVTVGGNALTFNSGIWSGNNGAASYSFELATGDLTVVAVPEPSAAMALIAGLGLCVALRRAPRNRTL